MNLIALLVGGIWAGVFAAALAIVFSVPVNVVFSGFCGGFVARFSRDVLLGWGAKPELATLVAAALVVFVGALLVRRHSDLLATVAGACVPLTPGTVFIRAITDFLLISSRPDDKLVGVPAELVSNLSRVFTTTVAIAVGLSLAILVLQTVKREHAE